MRRVIFAKPKVCKDGAACEVFLPSKGRTILAEGENVEVDAYIEARLKCGSLVEVKSETNKTKKKGDSE